MSTTAECQTTTGSSVTEAPAVRMITRCEVCHATELESVLNLGRHPLCDDLVRASEARRCERYPIEILWCPTCCTAHQRFQVPREALFPPTYHYRASLTRDVLDGMARLVDSVEAHVTALGGTLVVDVGCNDGSLLDRFAARGARTVGIEPTNAAIEAGARGHDVMQAYFDTEVARRVVAEHGHPGLITFTNVFAHIEHLDGVLEALRVLMGPETRLVIENHYLGAVVSGRQFDTFYHEHPRTYSQRSFEVIAARLGCAVERVEFPSRYGGNIRVVLGPVGMVRAGTPAPPPSSDERTFGAALAAMGAWIDDWRTTTRARVAALVAAHGPLRAKAFPGRAAILVELLQFDTGTIRAVFEQPASPKLGHFVPGTRIPIVSDELFDASDPAPVVNLAWHIHAEIEQYLRHRGFRGPVIPVLAAGDR